MASNVKFCSKSLIDHWDTRRAIQSMQTWKTDIKPMMRLMVTGSHKINGCFRTVTSHPGAVNWGMAARKWRLAATSAGNASVEHAVVALASLRACACTMCSAHSVGKGISCKILLQNSHRSSDMCLAWIELKIYYQLFYYTFRHNTKL